MVDLNKFNDEDEVRDFVGKQHFWSKKLGPKVQNQLADQIIQILKDNANLEEEEEGEYEATPHEIEHQAEILNNIQAGTSGLQVQTPECERSLENSNKAELDVCLSKCMYVYLMYRIRLPPLSHVFLVPPFQFFGKDLLSKNSHASC